jgi:hypothetical protein
MILGLALVGAAVAAGPARAGDREEAQAVIERAVKAHGGAEGLSRAAVATRSSTVALTAGAKAMTYGFEQTFQLPDKVRNVASSDGKTVVIMVLNGDAAWQSTGGPPSDTGKDYHQELREEAYVIWLSTLAPLMKGAFDLAPLPEIKVGDKPAVGVKVKRKDYPDVALYFDKASGLLVKADRKGREAGLLVRKEYYYKEHKAFDGVTLPTREEVWIEGRKFNDATGVTWKFLKSVNDDVFRKP